MKTSFRQSSLRSFFPNDAGVVTHSPAAINARHDPTTPIAAEEKPHTTKRKQPRDSNQEAKAAVKHLKLPADPLVEAPMTDYERQRQDNIRKNNEFMKNLGIPVHLEMLQKTTVPRPKIKPPQPPKPQLPLRRSTRNRPPSAETVSEESPVNVPRDRTPNLPVPPAHYDDSSVLKYMCTSSTSDGSSRMVSAMDPASSLVGFRRVGKIMADPLLTRIYTVDVAVLDGSDRALLAAGGHAGRISVYGTSTSSTQDCRKQTSQGPLMTWKGSPSWICGVKFLGRQGNRKVLLVAGSCNDGRLVLWDIGKQHHLTPPPIVAVLNSFHSTDIFGMHEFNTKIATVSRNSSVGFWNLSDSGFVADRSFSGHHHGPVRGVSFRDSDILADCGADNRICVLDLRLENCCTLTIESNHKTGVNVVEWCPNQEFLVLSASKDTELLLYDIRSYKEPLHKLKGHVDPKHNKCSQIYRPAFVANGMAVATPGQGSKQISLYSTDSGRAISRGFVGYDANLVMCNVRDEAFSQRVWFAGKQISPLSPIWHNNTDVSD
ncbi:hypothetical protein KI387_007834 [Taxus chinensis]|uniref:Uncharacterized protein n=1 Tax=Taxus chinensis TaxID=29808 RepID=A0AA38GS18_TAXCH|nr:hypothetical protein KI387_007834 [Taxus chinensis]